jgi:hypothetical protein
MSEHENLEALYGPAAPFSDHKPGEFIKWFDLEIQQERRAKILYVCAADPARELPVRYIMQTEGFPAIVYTGEVIE